LCEVSGLRGTRDTPKELVRNRLGKPGRPKGSTGPTRAKGVQLFDAGRSAPDIARELGLTRQAVYAHLKSAGRDARAARVDAR
jgi:hypothetical protein